MMYWVLLSLQWMTYSTGILQALNYFCTTFQYSLKRFLYKVKNSYFPSQSKLTYFLNGITLLRSLHVLQGVAWYYVCEYTHKFRLHI